MADPFEELITRPRRHETVVLAYDPTESDRLSTLKTVLGTLKRRVDRDPTEEAMAEFSEAARRVEELEGSMARIVFEFAGIGARRADAVLNEHPPTAEQIKKFKSQGSPAPFNPDTFPAAIISATCQKIVLPSGAEITGSAITTEAIQRLLDESMSQADQIELLNAALTVDQTGSSVEAMGKG